jgi:hypothetical protein
VRGLDAGLKDRVWRPKRALAPSNSAAKARTWSAQEDGTWPCASTDLPPMTLPPAGAATARSDNASTKREATATRPMAP